MAQQLINIGGSAEDHTGDGLRVGGDKINDNFTELYAKANLLNFDENGNLIANVTMRTGTYDNLMSLAGSLGEIGVCTDRNAIIRFNGVAGQAVPFFRNRLLQEAECTFNATVIAVGGTPTRLPFYMSQLAGDNFLVTGGYGSLPEKPAGVSPIMMVDVQLELGYQADLTAVTIWFYAEDAVGAGTYTNLGNRTLPLVSRSGCVDIVKYSFTQAPDEWFPNGWETGTRWYIAATHNSASIVVNQLSNYYVTRYRMMLPS